MAKIKIEEIVEITPEDICKYFNINYTFFERLYFNFEVIMGCRYLIVISHKRKITLPEDKIEEFNKANNISKVRQYRTCDNWENSKSSSKYIYGFKYKSL